MNPRLHLQLKTAWRLGHGALRTSWRRAAWPPPAAAFAHRRLLCVDVFDTLLFQDPELEAVLADANASALAQRLQREGLGEGLPASHWRGEMRRQQQRLCTAAGVPEVPRRQVYAAVLAEAGLGGRAEGVAAELLAQELTWHRRLTWPHAAMKPWLAEARARGLRVVAVSDSYLGADELAELLRHHGMPLPDCIYTSCEHGADKFHGDLFPTVLRAEGVPATQALHVGDRRTSDLWAPRSAGIAAWHCRPEAVRVAPAPPTADAAYRFGHDTLGPVFVAFAELLMREVRHQGWQRLAFVARDGDLLREVMQAWTRHRPPATPLALEYVYLSRRSTALAAAQRLDDAVLAQQQQIRAPGDLLARTLAFHGLQDLPRPSRLDDAPFQAAVRDAAQAQRQLLATYLQQQSLGTDDRSLLVDIGWRATIQGALHQAFAAQPGFVALPGCYLGLWGADLAPGAPPARGLIGDGNRRRSLWESAPWQAALLLEPLCRAHHGTVLGYTRDAAGRVQPRLDDRSAARQAEQAAHALVGRIRQGVLDHVASAAAGVPLPARAAGLRRDAQARLLRLAWLPRPDEVRLLGGLIHTESHVPDWSPTLVAREQVRPWRSPRRWLAGLASPWRGGYVAVTGGRALGLAFLALEAVLIAWPGLGRRLQTWARRQAGL